MDILERAARNLGMGRAPIYMVSDDRFRHSPRRNQVSPADLNTPPPPLATPSLPPFTFQSLFRTVLLLVLLAVFSGRLGAQDDPDPETPVDPDDIPAQVQALQAAGDKKLDGGDPPGAQEDFKQAFEIVRRRANENPKDLSLAEDVYYFLGKLAQAYAAAEDLPTAVKMQQRCADGYGKIATENATPENKARNAAALSQLTWYQILTGDAKTALQNARRAFALDPAQFWIRANLAHALLVEGEMEEAKKIYGTERTQELGDGTSFEQSVRADFEEMEKAGIAQDRIAQIRALYAGQSGETTGAVGPTSGHPRRTSGWWLIPVAAVVIATMVIALLLSRGRTPPRDIEASANQLGFRFSPEPPELDHPLIAGTHLVARGKRRSLRNILEKEVDGTHYTIFDIFYAGDSPGLRGSAGETVIRLESPRLCLPWFFLRPRSAPVLAVPAEVPLTGHGRFRELYSVHGDDEPAIRQLFTPAVMEYCEREQGLTIERRRDYLLAYWEGKRPRAEELGGFVQEGDRILSLFSHSTAAAA